jgi:DNA-binding response OmpR family regulator
MTARILVADDDETIIRLLTITLRNEGYELIIARNGRDALDMTNQEQPDMAILDVMMPEMTGFEVCHALRAQPETATMPIIILSGLSDVDDKVSGIQAGADEYVTKPIDLRELAARVSGLLRRNRMLRESAAPKAGKIVAVWGAKGGVGATTTALNIATVLMRANKSTVVVEMRGDYGTFSAQLKMRPERTLAALLSSEPAAITAPFLTGLTATTPFNLRVIFGPQRVEEFAELPENLVSAALARLNQMADFVILDVANGSSPAHQAIVRSSSQILLLFEPESTAVAAAGVRLQQFLAWGARPDQLVCLLVNRQGTALLSLHEVENQVGQTVIGMIPPAVESMAIATQYGMPLVLYQPTHITSVTYADLVTAVIDRSLAVAAR